MKLSCSHIPEQSTFKSNLIQLPTQNFNHKCLKASQSSLADSQRFIWKGLAVPKGDRGLHRLVTPDGPASGLRGVLTQILDPETKQINKHADKKLQQNCLRKIQRFSPEFVSWSVGGGGGASALRWIMVHCCKNGVVTFDRKRPSAGYDLHPVDLSWTVKKQNSTVICEEKQQERRFVQQMFVLELLYFRRSQDRTFHFLIKPEQSL